jgi:hypothetical protein
MKMKTDRRILCVVALAATLATWGSVANAQNFEIVPTPNQYEFNNELYASSASSPSDIWAVGNTTIHFDGKEWKEFPAPGAADDPSQYLRGVVTISPELAWAAGGDDEKGQIIDKWNGKKWTRVKGLPLEPSWNPKVLAMCNHGADDIWAMGLMDVSGNPQLFFEHWDGQAWTAKDFLPGGVGWLYGASQIAENDAWTVGVQLIEYDDFPLALHFDGNTWTQANLPFPKGAQNAELLGIVALAPNNVWAVGWQNPSDPDYYTNLTLIYHFDGKNWTIVPSPITVGTNLAGIVANSPNDMYAFGYAADPSGYGFDSLLLHWNGSEWKVIPSPNPRNNQNYIENDLNTGVVPSQGNVWIFGGQYDSQGTVCTDGECTLAIHKTK